MATGRLDELRLGDLSTFLAVARTGSIARAARELRVTSSQVSKAIRRLEVAFRTRLLSRNSRGVALSENGRRVLPHVQAALSRLQFVDGSAVQTSPELTVAAPSSLIEALLPTIALCQPQLRVRGIELPAALVRAYAAENFFDLCLLSTGNDRLPSTWTSVRVGELRQGLFAAPRLARKLGPGPVHVEAFRGIPFISPVYNVEGQFVPVSDDCPLKLGDRVLGHQTQTIGLALELAAATDQVVFGPVIAARRHLLGGTLVEIRVHDWDVREPVYVVSNGDRVLARVNTAIIVAVEAAMREMDPR